MKQKSAAQQFMEQQAELQWALRTWDEQPDDVQRLYLEAAHQLVDALIHTTSRLSLQLPPLLYQKGSPVSVPRQMVLIRIKSLMTLLRQESVRELILKEFACLTTHSNLNAAQIARLTAFLTARHIVYTAVPDPDSALTLYQFFDRTGALKRTMEEARKGVELLCQFMAWMTLAEQLSPTLAADPAYDDKRVHWLNHLVSQGRWLSARETEMIIDELLTRLKSGELMRGLTLFIPYLDEQRYQQAVYKVVVVPTSRIPFHAEFVMGACRLEEQRVRQNPHFSQSTRWQIISQLNQIHQAFEAFVHHTT